MVGNQLGNSKNIDIKKAGRNALDANIGIKPIDHR
jgi:hypothetical protein